MFTSSEDGFIKAALAESGTSAGVKFRRHWFKSSKQQCMLV